MQSANERIPGEIFTSSILKKATPLLQFAFVMTIGILSLLIAKFGMDSKEMILYAGCFGVVFYVMFNPWFCLLATDNKKYAISSWIFYFLIAFILYGLVYLWTGLGIMNSWEIKIILVTTTFYMIVAYGMMLALKLLFLDVSGGGV